MNSVDKTLAYYELLMVRNDLSNLEEFVLPYGFSFEFWRDEHDLQDWINIHIKSGEFVTEEYAKKVFQDFYSSFLDELHLRCFFIVNDKNEKIATATISPSEEHGYNCVIDWLAIAKDYQGKGLAKPLITMTLKVAKKLGCDKILLHTQTHSWLAVKLYLDLEFEPYNLAEDIRGWQIIKTITNHEKLKNIKAIAQKEMYSETALNIIQQLDKTHKNYEYQIWHKNGMHEIWVRDEDKVFFYDYEDEGRKISLRS